jgi:hypothetical protein
MRAPSLLVLSCLALATGAATGLAASPDDAEAGVPVDRYRPVFSGTKSYRPVEPLPWADVNRRVGAPSDRQRGEPVPDTKGAAPAPIDRHKH